MKHSKTTKKLSNKLNTIIELIKTHLSDELSGFTDIKLTVQFDCFPGSILLACHFENNESLAAAKGKEITYQKMLHKLLLKQGIVLKQPSQNLVFTINACE